MNRYQKFIITGMCFLTALGIAACGVDETAANQQGNGIQTAENADSEMTADELLDLFIDGSISAAYPADKTSAFYITDLNMDAEDWDSFSIGERTDLDNDGENELVICGPYGGMYLDARDNGVYGFAMGGGTALCLSYTCYNDEIWIMYSNRGNTGYEAYHMERYDGADNLVEEMDFGWELAEQNNSGSETKYTWNGTEIAREEYEEVSSEVFGAEVR